MSDAKITIIVTLYNSEPYLTNLIECLKNQSCQEFAIVVIDDGSSDGGAAAFQENFEGGFRFRLVRQKNSGVARARNVGLSLVETEYAVFLDSDDFIKVNAVEIILDALSNCADIVMYNADVNEGYGIGLTNKKFYSGRPAGLNNRIITGQEFFEASILENAYIEQPCMYAFKVSVLRGLTFSEGYIYEDSIFTTRLLLQNEDISVYCIPDKLYIRTARPDSITTREKNKYNYLSFLNVVTELKRISRLRLSSAAVRCLDIYINIFVNEAVRLASTLHLSAQERVQLIWLVLLAKNLKKRRDIVFRIVNPV